MDKEILNYIKEGIDTRPKLLEYFPSSTLIFHINNLKAKGYVTKQTDNKSAKYIITNDGIKYLKTIKIFSLDKKVDPKETIDLLQEEFEKQIIFPDDTVRDIFMTIPSRAFAPVKDIVVEGGKIAFFSVLTCKLIIPLPFLKKIN